MQQGEQEVQHGLLCLQLKQQALQAQSSLDFA
jgi:hypothetical protein